MAMQAGSTVLADAGKAGREAAIAVIDIGSNSIRLVIYASGGRYPFPLFNERSNCRLGEGLGEDGSSAQLSVPKQNMKATRIDTVSRTL